jgi:hypothetical protein
LIAARAAVDAGFAAFGQFLCRMRLTYLAENDGGGLRVFVF